MLRKDFKVYLPDNAKSLYLVASWLPGASEIGTISNACDGIFGMDIIAKSSTGWHVLFFYQPIPQRDEVCLLPLTAWLIAVCSIISAKAWGNTTRTI